MGINNVLGVLQDLDKSRPKEWFTIAEVKKELEKKGFSNGSVQKTFNHLIKLSIFKLVDTKGQGLVHHIKLFKLHKSTKSES